MIILILINNYLSMRIIAKSELIKNKTLQYLSKTLPYLKDEIENVPKVARFVKPSEFFEKLVEICTIRSRSNNRN